MSNNILFLYNSTQTYTNAVFEHLENLRKHSTNNIFFCHCDASSTLNIDPRHFNAIAIHYSVRLPYDQISAETAEVFSHFAGLKVLFIQDEYDHTHRAWHWIKKLGIQLVFTVVPQDNISKVYPPDEFPGVRFVSVLTGYVPEELLPFETLPPPSTRTLLVGYRGRPLHLRYGQLGREKIQIGKQVKEYCKINNIPHDIEFSEEQRIYGKDWYEFILSCRSMLGTESGSNVFDWDATLSSKVDAFLREKNAGQESAYKELIEPNEIPGLMNQISPRVFESIALRTVMVLYEGTYSNVILPDRHFIPLKKNGGNLAEIISKLNDAQLVDDMTARAYEEVIASGKYSYRSFATKVDEEIAVSLENLPARPHPSPLTNLANQPPAPITTSPIRSQPAPTLHSPDPKKRLLAAAYLVWGTLPEALRRRLLPGLKLILGKR